MANDQTMQTAGHVYILHFDRPIGNLANARAMARHYVGFAEDVESRIELHKRGQAGVKLTTYAAAVGVVFDVFTFPAVKAVERLIKNRKETAVFCPACAAAAGKAPKPLPQPPTAPAVDQLAFDLDDDLADLAPAVPAKADWFEYATMRRWRQASVRPVDPAALDDLL